MENLLEELKASTYLHWTVFGIDLSITKAVVVLWISLALVFLLVWMAGRRARMVPSRFQNMMESMLEFVRESMVLEVMGKEGLPYFPLVATLFLFILVTNLIGLIPGSYAATSLTGTTAAWAVIVFIAYHLIGVRKHGAFGYLKSFVPSGVPIPLLIIMLPIEIVSHAARPFSLAVRLFANMTAGHLVLLVFTVMAISSAWYMKWLPFAGVVIFYLFEIFVSFIQAYIFAILTAIYIGGAIHVEH
jgi:F-type H+-transporting ATPase subunit a